MAREHGRRERVSDDSRSERRHRSEREGDTKGRRQYSSSQSYRSNRSADVSRAYTAPAAAVVQGNSTFFRSGNNASVVAASTPTATPSPSSLPFSQFLKSTNYLLASMIVGTWRLDVDSHGRPFSLAPPQRGNAVISPDVATWNSYWEAFFSIYGPLETQVKTQLECEYEQSRGTRYYRTMVVLKTDNDALLSSPVDDSGYPCEITNILTVAETFGTVIGLSTQQSGRIVVQFSSWRPAELFMLHLINFGIDVECGGEAGDFIKGDRKDSKTRRLGGDLWRHRDGYLASRQGAVFSVDPDIDVDLDTADGTRNVLALGPITSLPQPYVDALGRIFDTQTSFVPNPDIQGCGHYLLTFKSIKQARYCVHVLHRSLQSIFGLSLVQSTKETGKQWEAPCHAIRI